jgi:uncharacterized membrane protein YhaH (DUF805 family)
VYFTSSPLDGRSRHLLVEGVVNWKGLFTSFNGRINRKKWWIGTLVLFLLFFLIWFLLLRYFDIRLSDALDPSTTPERNLANWRNAQIVQIAAVLIVAFPVTALIKKRLHDRNRPDWLLYIFWTPTLLGLLLNLFGLRYMLSDVDVVSTWAGSLVDIASGLIAIWAVVELGILKGTAGPNRHGPDPLTVWSPTAGEGTKVTPTKANSLTPIPDRHGALHRWRLTFTSFDGRIGRKEFWFRLFVLIGLQGVSFVLIVLLFSAFLENQKPNWSESQTTMDIVAALFPALLIWFAIGLWPTLAVFTKRWHDQDKSGWWNLSAPPFVFFAAVVITLVVFSTGYEGPLLILLPIALWASIIWTIIALGFIRGTNGPNRYGPDPSAA